MRRLLRGQQSAIARRELETFWDASLRRLKADVAAAKRKRRS